MSADELFSNRASLPTLRGHFRSDVGVWAGQWAMNEYEFFHGLKGEFEYKRTKKQVPASAASSSSSFDRPSELPPDMYVSGYFTYQESAAKKSKVSETSVLVRFSPELDEEGVSLVTGQGSNANGEFHMLGSYNVHTSELQIERAFVNSLLVVAASATVPAAAPTSELPLHLPQRARRSRVGMSAEQQRVRDMAAVLDKLRREDRAQYFLLPVDCATWTDYLDHVSQPMDFSTVATRLASSSSDDGYATASQVEEDIALVFRNAQTYNPVGTMVYEEAKRLSGVFRRELGKLHKTWQKDEAAAGEEDADEDVHVEAALLPQYEEEHFTKSGRKSRPPAKLKNTASPSLLPASATTNSVASVVAAATAAANAAMAEEIRALKAKVRQLEEVAPVPSGAAATARGARPHPVSATKKQQLQQQVLPSPRRPANRDDIALSYQEQRVLAQQMHKLSSAQHKRQLAGMVNVLVRDEDEEENGDRVVEFNLAQQPISVQRALAKFVREHHHV